MASNLIWVVVHTCGLLSSCSVLHSEKGEDYKRGEIAADADIAEGRLLRQDYFGIIRSKNLEFRRILKEKYGIEHETNPSESPAYIEGYNKRMDVELRKRFGQDYYTNALSEIESVRKGQFSAFGRR